MYKPKAQAQSGQTVMDGAQPSNAKRVENIPPDLKVIHRYIHHPFCVHYPSDVSDRKSQELVAESNLLRTIQKAALACPVRGQKGAWYLRVSDTIARRGSSHSESLPRPT